MFMLAAVAHTSERGKTKSCFSQFLFCLQRSATEETTETPVEPTLKTEEEGNFKRPKKDDDEEEDDEIEESVKLTGIEDEEKLKAEADKILGA
jgi:DNA-binding transcriptional regulator GbsR (MarR family)